MGQIISCYAKYQYERNIFYELNKIYNINTLNVKLDLISKSFLVRFIDPSDDLFIILWSKICVTTDFQYVRGEMYKQYWYF